MKTYKISIECLQLAAEVCESSASTGGSYLQGAKDDKFDGMQLKAGKFIDLLSDTGFKIAFGTERAQTDMIALTNAVLCRLGLAPITSIGQKNVERIGDNKENRRALLDTFFTDQMGRSINVEMQKSLIPNMAKRMSFHISRVHSGLLVPGVAGNSYSVPPIIGIAILNYVAFPEGPCVFLADVNEKERGFNVCDVVNMIFIQLPLFKKGIDELIDDCDKFLYLLKYLGNLQEIPAIFTDNKFGPFLERMRIANLNKNEMENYMKTKMAEERNQGYLMGAELKGKLKGKLEGKMEGKMEKAKQVIKNLLADTKLTKAQIAEAVSVPLDVVEQIYKDGVIA